MDAKALTKRNEHWMDQAESVGLELWERQPHETDSEWAAWCSFRKFYPGKQRTKTVLAEEIGISVGNLYTIMKRWDYAVRLRAWALHIDSQIKDTHYNDIMEMNRQHVDMAKRLNEKVSEAIDYVDPTALTPTQLVSLAKMTTEMEQKARVSNLETVESKSENAGVVEHKAKEEVKVKKEDMAEVLGILMSAGAIVAEKVKKVEVIQHD